MEIELLFLLYRLNIYKIYSKNLRMKLRITLCVNLSLDTYRLG